MKTHTHLFAAILAAGCGSEPVEVPAVATPTVTLSHDRAPAGSPLEITYRFVVAGDAPSAPEFDRTSSLPITRASLTFPNWGLLSVRGLAAYARALRQLWPIVKRVRPKVVAGPRIHS
jgi:hypothetical protein